MKHLKKISLANQVSDNVKVAILNDDEKRRLFQQHINKQSQISEPLVNRLWQEIQRMTKQGRQNAVKIIEILESSPSFEVSPNLELIYNGETQGGTNILQLIKARGTPRTGTGRALLPGQALFDYIISTAPLSNEITKIKVDPKKVKKRTLPFSPRKTRSKKTKNIFPEKQWNWEKVFRYKTTREFFCGLWIYQKQ